MIENADVVVRALFHCDLHLSTLFYFLAQLQRHYSVQAEEELQNHVGHGVEGLAVHCRDSPVIFRSCLFDLI